MSSKDHKRRVDPPKFASFKPTAVTPAAEPGPIQKSKDSPAVAKGDVHSHAAGHNSQRDEAERAHHRHRHRHRHRHSRERSPVPGSDSQRRDQAHDGNRSRDKDRASQSSKPAPTAGDPALFFFDRRGDPLIRQFGSNDRAKVPDYRRFGAGRLLGAEGRRFDVQFRGSREVFTLQERFRGDGGGSILGNKRALLLAKSRAGSRPKRVRQSGNDGIATSPGGDGGGGVQDFIPLGRPSRKRKRSQSPLSRLWLGKTPVEIEGRAEDGDDGSSSDRDSDSESGNEEFEMTAAKKKSIELSRSVRDRPDDMNGWFELIALQGDLFRENRGDGAAEGEDGIARMRNEKRGIAELRVGLYEEALPHASVPRDRERLLVGLMREGARVWSPKALARRWDEMTGRDGGDCWSFALWKERLAYELTNMATFSYERVRAFFVVRLRRLRSDLAAAAAAAAASPDEDEATSALVNQIVYVLLRLSCFLRDCGYIELAVAMWQSMLEISFSRAPVAEDLAAAPSLFADFWESEVPRIGEPGAKGWARFTLETAADDVPEAKRRQTSSPDDDGKDSQHSDPCRAWAAVERRETARSRMPARTLDEGTDEDPYRVVMASDLEDLLVWIPAALLPHVRPRLADAFLLFAGLPPAFLPGGSSATTDETRDDPFVVGPRGGVFGGRDPAAELEPSTRRSNIAFAQDGAHIALSPDVLFAGPAWFPYLPSWTDMFATPDDEQVDRAWVVGTLRYLVLVEGVEALADYYLAMEWRNGDGAGGLRKVAKALLKRYPNNMRLYAGYALIEWANGNLDMSRKVLSSATAQNLSPEPGGNQLLWNTWAWIELETGEKQAAVARLFWSVAGPDHRDTGLDEPPLALRLTARSHFASTRDYSVSAGKVEKALQHAESLALFEYLTAQGEPESASASGPLQGDIAAAMLSLRSFSDELCARGLGASTHHERLLQFAARLLYYHANHGPFRPAYLRSQLGHLVELAPHNTLLLSLFEWAHYDRDRGLFVLQVDDPVRALLQQHGGGPTAGRAFAVRHELRYGTAHSARRAFDDALVAGEACRGCVALWRDCVRFCARRATELWGGGGGVRKDRNTRDRDRDRDRNRAKEVLYRALAACPFARALYMEAFRDDNGAAAEAGSGGLGMDSAELHALADAIAAKGLRLHVGLGESAEGAGGGDI